ncbi:CxC2 domain-containing protein [Mycena kentingensis (nom. inval.)]|nr:CxC2 domain-containing protein [Mycena kentingensis (nom. inval.)]
MNYASTSKPSHKRRHPGGHRDSPSTHHHHSFSISDFLPPSADAPVVTYVDRVSSDNRRTYSTPVTILPPSPVKRMRADIQRRGMDRPPPLMVVVEAERYTMDELQEHELADNADESPETPAQKRTCSDPAMNAWMPQRDAFLSALLWRDGRGSHQDVCPTCKERPAVARCRDCLVSRVTCTECCSAAHSGNPFHWVEEWNGAYFSRRSLRDFGMHVQLGHYDGSQCGRPRSARDDFVVIDRNGIQYVALDFCGCYHTTDATPIQLLKVGLYPATLESPRTCVTFGCLDLFQTLSLQGKTTAYDFYASLESLTNATGDKPPDRYRVFLRVVRQYRHLMLLKRAGRGHDRFGVMGTADGELVLRCPACPRPGVNLPENWHEASADDRCLYIQYIAMDACFRLKRRLISSWARDPGLGTGWAYMIAPGPYLDYIASVGEQKEMSSCSGLAAIDHANDKFSRGYAVTGVGMGICARHEFILPTSVGDLQKGERYANMDYIFVSFMRHLLPILWLVVSYDIACQWSKHLRERLANLPASGRLMAILKIVELARFVIPKMHIKGHVILCQLLFAIAASTRASGPGSRADQLDDHWGFWNWAKLLKLASLLRRRHDKAVYELAAQEAALEQFSVEQSADVPGWIEMVHRFEADSTQPNPYKVKVEGLTERQVRDRFEEEEAKEVAAGRVPIHDIGPAEFMTFLLHVEDEQRRVHSLAALKQSKSTTQKINLRRQRRALNMSIQRVRSLQATYMPCALKYLESLNLAQDTVAELVPILPPSGLPHAMRSDGGCWNGLVELERSLRDAQCGSALLGLRIQLHVKQRLLLYKRHHSRHQGANTRSRALVSRNETKILCHADKYQAARRAMVSIEGGEEASVSWPMLLKDHIRCMDDSDVVSESRPDVFGSRASRETVMVSGESRRVISWIWRMTGSAGSEAEMRDSIRVEWSKAYARVRRWREEVRILAEEWRRLPLLFAYEERQWSNRAAGVEVGKMDVEQAEGLVAYAAKQADVYRNLARRAEQTRTAPRLRRGQRRSAVVREEISLAGQGGTEDTDSGFDGEEVEVVVDEFGNASDDDDEDAIMDGDVYDD